MAAFRRPLASSEFQGLTTFRPGQWAYLQRDIQIRPASDPTGSDLQTPSGPPGGEALRVLGGDAGWGTVGPPEDDGHRLQPGGHVVGLGGGIDDLVDGLHGEVKGHELTDGPEAGLEEGNSPSEPSQNQHGDSGRTYHGGSDGNAGESHLRQRHNMSRWAGLTLSMFSERWWLTSEIGVSMIRLSPYFFHRPLLTCRQTRTRTALHTLSPERVLMNSLQLLMDDGAT